MCDLDPEKMKKEPPVMKSQTKTVHAQTCATQITPSDCTCGAEPTCEGCNRPEFSHCICQELQADAAVVLAKVGDRVRSHDFGKVRPAGRNPCYVEGEVKELTERYGCPYVKIWTTRRVWDGQEQNCGSGYWTLAPQNGIPTSLGELTNNLEVIA